MSQKHKNIKAQSLIEYLLFLGVVIAFLVGFMATTMRSNVETSMENIVAEMEPTPPPE